MEKEGGGLGRFLVIATPILFTLVLIGAIIMLFNVNLRNTMFNTLDKIPVVKNLVPSADNSSSADPATNQAESTAATVDQLKQQLSDAQKTSTDQAKQIQELKSELNSKSGTTGNGTSGTTDTTTTGNTSAGSTSSSTTQTAQDKQLKNLASVYSNMTAAKAAAIMQNMTTDEQVLIFSKMNAESQAGILQKMDPKAAAVTSLALKNATPASLAAMQAAAANEKPVQQKTVTKLDTAAMAQTFTTMPATSAASLLLQTAKVSQTKAIQVLNNLDDATRAGILSAMSTQDPAATAQIVNRLLGN